MANVQIPGGNQVRYKGTTKNAGKLKGKEINKWEITIYFCNLLFMTQFLCFVFRIPEDGIIPQLISNFYSLLSISGELCINFFNTIEALQN